MKLFYLIVYATIMCIIAVNSWRKKKNTIYKMMWFAYAFTAVACVISKIFQKELMGEGVMLNKWYDLSDTTLWGYLLITLSCLIAFRPFERFDKNSAIEELGSSKGSRLFYLIYSVTYILSALLFILLTFNTIKDLFRINDFGMLRISLYGNNENESNFVMTTNFVANLCYKLCLQFKYLSVFIAFIMIKEKARVRLASGLLVTTFFVYYLYAIANAARGGLMIFCFCSFLVGTCFLGYMSKSSKRKIMIIGVAIFGILLSFVIAVTVSRFGNDQGRGNPIVRNIFFYLGHGPIEFSKITGSLTDFAYGKTIIGRLLNHYFGVPYSWESIQRQIGYPDLGPVFVTFLGYQYTDFGAIGCLIFVSLWSQFLCRLLRKSSKRISTMFLFLYYLNYYVTGIFVVGRLEYAGMITAHVIFLGIRFIEDFLKERNRVRVYTV